MRYEVQPVTEEQFVERTIRHVGYVSKFRVYETIVRVVVTRVNVELVGPDGSTVVSRYSVSTRYVESEQKKPGMTVFLGVVKLEEATTTPPAETRRPEVQPVTTTPVRGLVV